MKNVLLLLLFAFAGFPAVAQPIWQESDAYKWQRHYKAELLSDPRSPVKAKDTAFLRFYPPQKNLHFNASVVLTPEALPFDMGTHSGKTKRFRQYARISFPNPGKAGPRKLSLSVYERVDRPASDTQSAQSLFLPFQDRTNGDGTYGGGRYIDLKKADIHGVTIILDFNKAYNPYCAFGDGFSCPIPPEENRLGVPIVAGEMLPAPPLLPAE